MKLEHLLFVHQITERLDLLKIGEDRAMSFIDFADYVVNYILCFNEEHGETYSLTNNRTTFDHVVRNKYEVKTSSVCEPNK